MERATVPFTIYNDSEASAERAAISEAIALDLLNAVEAIYGADGLAAVTNHARRANKAREDNAEIDALEKIFERR